MRFSLQLSVLAGIFTVGVLPTQASFATSSDLSNADTKLQTEDLAALFVSQIAQNSPPPNRPENLQPNPNQDRFLQPQLPSVPVPETTPAPVTPTPTPESAPATNTTPIQVKRIEIIGNTVLTPEQLQKITKPIEGRTVLFQELTNVVNEINKLYLEQGYASSRTILEPQSIDDGIVKIRAIEGSIERIEVEGTRRLNPNYVRSRVKLGVGTPLNTTKLEDQLRLLRADPLFKNVEATLRSGSGEGKSILVVRVNEANPFEANVSVDNYSPPKYWFRKIRN